MIWTFLKDGDEPRIKQVKEKEERRRAEIVGGKMILEKKKDSKQPRKGKQKTKTEVKRYRKVV